MQIKDIHIKTDENRKTEISDVIICNLLLSFYKNNAFDKIYFKI